MRTVPATIASAPETLRVSALAATSLLPPLLFELASSNNVANLLRREADIAEIRSNRRIRAVYDHLAHAIAAAL